MRPFSISAMGATTISAWIPTTVSGLQGWWKPETLDTQGMTTGDDIDNAAGKYWPDSSGNTSDMASQTTGSAPNYTTNVVNGKSVARFAKANTDRLLLKSGGTSAPTNQKPVTVFAVVNPASLTAGADIIGASGTTGYRFKFVITTGRIAISVSGTTSSTSTTGMTAGNWYILIWTLDGSDNYAFYINSTTADVTGSFAQSPTNGNRQISGSATSTPFDGDIAEAGQYDSVLSSTDRSNLYNYLSTKYSI